MGFETAEEAYAFEAVIVDQDFVDRDDCYNISLGGHQPPIRRSEDFTLEAKRNMSISKRGGKNPNAKRVMCTDTGVIYDSCAEAAIALGMKKTTLKCWLNPNHGNINKTSLVYICDCEIPLLCGCAKARTL